MNSNGPEVSDLLHRVERLERQNRWLKRVGIAALAAVSAILLMGLAAPVPKILEARKFVLLDAAGHERAELSMGDSGLAPGLRIFDASGNNTASFSSTPYGPIVLLKHGGSSSSLLIAKSTPLLDLMGGGADAKLQVNGGYSRLQFDQKKFKDTVMLSSSPVGSALTLSEGKQSANIGIGTNPAIYIGPFVRLSDADGFSTDIGSTYLVSPSTGETRHTSADSIVMFGKKDHVIWEAPQ